MPASNPTARVGAADALRLNYFRAWQGEDEREDHSCKVKIEGVGELSSVECLKSQIQNELAMYHPPE